MKIDCKNLHCLVHNNALACIMIKDKDKAEKISKTLTKDNRVVEVELYFNGVNMPAEIIEEWLLEQHNLQCEKLKQKYSDIEKEVHKRVEKELKKLTAKHIEQLKQKTQKIQDVLDKINNAIDYNCWDEI